MLFALGGILAGSVIGLVEGIVFGALLAIFLHSDKAWSADASMTEFAVLIGAATGVVYGAIAGFLGFGIAAVSKAAQLQRWVVFRSVAFGAFFAALYGATSGALGGCLISKLAGFHTTFPLAWEYFAKCFYWGSVIGWVTGFLAGIFLTGFGRIENFSPRIFVRQLQRR